MSMFKVRSLFRIRGLKLLSRSTEVAEALKVLQEALPILTEVLPNETKRGSEDLRERSNSKIAVNIKPRFSLTGVSATFPEE